eukprot:TRINITY_DN14614_c0_g1_i1.p1 TRINITY_DN14614_c0_g1~~TRINITY_DN14614_c0_g1_i1.p1  ORF type:complete len:558 (+),score=84.54 TRINITY_DN14614_c0_g1_i1:34-1674(+)
MDVWQLLSDGRHYLLYSPFLTLVEFVGACASVILTITFILVIWGRKRLMARMRAAGEYKVRPMPNLTIIMPCKGIHDRTISNWHAQVGTQYNGKIHFIWVTESEIDPAYPAAKEFAKKYSTDRREMSVYVAGISWHNSQKVHNWIKGLSEVKKDSVLVMCLDDDIKMYPHSLEEMASRLEDETMFASTGYSFEIPHKDASIVNYLIMCYRLILYGAFFHEHPYFLWGGCMMLRQKDIVENSYGVVDAWRDGGYSEDFLTVSILKHAQRPICFPLTSVYPNVLKGYRSFYTYWNFICRQFFVLKTYCSKFNMYHNFILVLAQVVIPIVIFYPMLFALPKFLMVLWNLRSQTLEAWWATHEQGLYVNAFFLISHVALFFGALSMIHTLAELCNFMSGDTREPVDSNLPKWKYLLGIWAHGLVLPFACTWAYMISSIEWAGTMYHVHDGRVTKMERKDAEGKWYSKSYDDSLELAVLNDVRAGFLNPDSTQVYHGQLSAAAAPAGAAEEKPAVARSRSRERTAAAASRSRSRDAPARSRSRSRSRTARR